MTLEQSKHTLLNKRILVIVAHPDDEGFLMSGMAYLNAQAGGQTTLICATLGEKGTSHLSYPVTPKQMKSIRKRELMNATRYAKFSKVYILNFPDGGVKQQQISFSKQCEVILKRVQPELVISFGPDGMTGHRDHIACWHAARALSKKYSLPFYMATPAPRRHTSIVKALLRQRVNPHYDDIVPYQPATVKIPVRRSFKRRVLRLYPSQTNVSRKRTTRQ